MVIKAKFKVYWSGASSPEIIEVKYNPTSITFEKRSRRAEIEIPMLDSPLLQFVRGESETLEMELFFDTTQYGMSGNNLRSVTEETDKIYGLSKIEPGRHAPPICEFAWNDAFPGSGISEHLGNQRRNSFKCVVESVRQQFTFFSPEGVPLRAKLNVTLKEYKTLHEQLNQLTSRGQTRSHIVLANQSIQEIARQHYDNPEQWRQIAEANNISDPSRMPSAGTVLTIPPRGH